MTVGPPPPPNSLTCQNVPFTGSTFMPLKSPILPVIVAGAGSGGDQDDRLHRPGRVGRLSCGHERRDKAAGGGVDAPPTVSDSMKPRPISPTELIAIAGSTQ